MKKPKKMKRLQRKREKEKKESAGRVTKYDYPLIDGREMTSDEKKNIVWNREDWLPVKLRRKKTQEGKERKGRSHRKGCSCKEGQKGQR